MNISLKSKILTMVLVFVIVAAAFTAGAGWMGSGSVTATPVLYNENTVTSIYQSANPAVVEIEVTQVISSYFGGSTQEGSGSGFLVDQDGNIVTNKHVVDGASTVTVIFSNGTKVSGKVMGTDSTRDLAVVKVDAAAVSGITPLTLGDSTTVKVGQMAIAIGSPYGLMGTATVGIISGLDRSIGNLSGMIQTDAALNPGNSGGPLLNADGMVIGVNTAAETGSYGISAGGIGFAVPSNAIKEVLARLKSGQNVVAAWLGISGRTLTPELASSLNLDVEKGVLVVSVVSGSPAEKAGLQGTSNRSSARTTVAGDVIIKANDQAIDTIEALRAFIRSKVVGDTIQLTIQREMDTLNLTVTLAEMPEQSTLIR
ncbi:MAG TPA: trypsin-like peptidase domain-containing protein [Dehalococcoidales bacterium]|nr:trypsin-like peptidase domain-containing protein [Dehalococcoidales bacterium]